MLMGKQRWPQLRLDWAALLRGPKQSEQLTGRPELRELKRGNGTLLPGMAAWATEVLGTYERQPREGARVRVCTYRPPSSTANSIPFANEILPLSLFAVYILTSQQRLSRSRYFASL